MGNAESSGTSTPYAKVGYHVLLVSDEEKQRNERKERKGEEKEEREGEKRKGEKKRKIAKKRGKKEKRKVV